MPSYREEVIQQDTTLAAAAAIVSRGSYENCSAIEVLPLERGGFRGSPSLRWKRHILELMLEGKMSEVPQSDGAGHKPQFCTVIGTTEVFEWLPWEMLIMNVDDVSAYGDFPVVVAGNQIDFQRLTKENEPLMRAMFTGFGKALKKAGLVCITGESAKMKYAITAFFGTDDGSHLILTWSGTVLGLRHNDKVIDGQSITPGLPIVGLHEKGMRCNGATGFINLLIEVYGSPQAVLESAEARKLIQQLTIPSVCCAPTISRVHGWKPDGNITEPIANMLGIANITGGGIGDKLGDLLPAGIGANLNSMPAPPGLFVTAQKLSLHTDSPWTDKDVLDWSNGGLAMAVVCASDEDVGKLIREATRDGIDATTIGETTDSPGIRVKSRFRDGGDVILGQ